MSQKTWGGRFSGDTDNRAERFTLPPTEGLYLPINSATGGGKPSVEGCGTVS